MLKTILKIENQLEKDIPCLNLSNPLQNSLSFFRSKPLLAKCNPDNPAPIARRLKTILDVYCL